jgi:hypothetical protein
MPTDQDDLYSITRTAATAGYRAESALGEALPGVPKHGA